MPETKAKGKAKISLTNEGSSFRLFIQKGGKAWNIPLGNVEAGELFLALDNADGLAIPGYGEHEIEPKADIEGS